jgi:hypothetical protein
MSILFFWCGFRAIFAFGALAELDGGGQVCCLPLRQSRFFVRRFRPAYADCCLELPLALSAGREGLSTCTTAAALYEAVCGRS